MRKLSDRQKNKRKNPVLKQDTILQEDMFEVAENVWDILIENKRLCSLLHDDFTLYAKFWFVFLKEPHPIDLQSDRLNGGVKLNANLFHSFREFNVGQDRGVYFVNPEVITEYILSRYKFHHPCIFQNWDTHEKNSLKKEFNNCDKY